MLSEHVQEETECRHTLLLQFLVCFLEISNHMFDMFGLTDCFNVTSVKFVMRICLMYNQDSIWGENEYLTA